MKIRHSWLGPALAGALFFATAETLSAQSGGGVEPHLEAGGFIGGQFWKLRRGNFPYPNSMGASPFGGGRLGYEFSPRWALETSLGFGFSKETFSTPQSGRLEFSGRNLEWMAGPLIYLNSRYSRVRPFLTAGPALQVFSPSSSARDRGLSLGGTPSGSVMVRRNHTGALVYGGGFKAWLNEKAHFRFDLRGLFSGNPHLRYFGDSRLPNGVLLPGSATGHGLQATAGLGWAMRSPGYETDAPALRVTVPNRTVYQGQKATFAASTDAPAGSTVRYSWQVAGQPSGNGETIAIDTTNRAPGTYPVQATATASGRGMAAGTGTLTVLKQGEQMPEGVKDLQLAVAGPDQIVWQGQKAWFGATSVVPPGGAKYNWSIGGQPSGDSQVIAVDTTDRKPGRYPVQVSAAAPGYNSATANSTLIVKKPKAKDMILNVEGSDQTVYQGEPASFKLNAKIPPGVTPTYSWRVAGQPAGSGETIAVQTGDRSPGVYPVVVEASAPKAKPAQGWGMLTVLPKKDMKLAVTAPDRSLYQGERARFSVNHGVTDGTPVTCKWTIDGQPAGTGESIEVDTANMQPGPHKVEVTCNGCGYNPATGNSTLTVLKPEPPTLSLSGPAEIGAGSKAQIDSNARLGAGAGKLGSVRYTVSEGSISPTGEFDSSSIQFDPSNPGEQRKTVTITATVTDDKGNTTTATRQITIVRKAMPQATRLPDIVFPVNNARVNNCGKRVLLEELKTYFDRDPTGKVILAGHVDEREKAGLDQQRALNAAAVITAGEGICTAINRVQVLITAVGTAQTSTPNPYLCGTSATPKTEERRGSAIRENDDRAQYRRVEVWFVPTGGVLPAGLADLKDANALPVAPLGCPK